MSLIVCYRCTCSECGQDIYAQAQDLGAMLTEHTATHQTEECTCGVAWDVAEGPCVCESADSGSALDDCDACDTPLSECGGREAACCADCTHGNNWPDPDWYDTHCPTCDAPEPTHTPTCAVLGPVSAEVEAERVPAPPAGSPVVPARVIRNFTPLVCVFDQVRTAPVSAPSSRD